LANIVKLMKLTGTGWANTEFRTYQFKEGHEDHASLVETAQSRQLRNGTETPPTETEQTELKRVAMTTWVDIGYCKL